MTIPAPGTIIDRYRVDEPIGSGSMGDVVRGIDVDLQRPVAIKLLSDKHRDNEELHARFVREGRAVAAISHANVVQVFTTGSWDGRPYIAMELLRGVDLGTVVKQHGVMGSLTAARALLDAARGLDAAARAGLIHRDVKPSNLVLTDTGLVKVTDFGLAKPIDPKSEPALTALGVVVGTPDFIAPEQARGETIDERVDIYALGGTLYFLLAGAPPFRTGNPADDKYLKVVARHLKEPPPDPRTKNRSADDELAALGVRMMAKRASDRPRYPELIERLAALVERLQRGRDEAPPRVQTGPVVPEPTPFVGGGRARSHGGEPAPSPGGVAGRGAGPARAATRPPVDPAPPSSPGIADLGPTRPARWLLATTTVSVAIFAAGLGLYLLGPRPALVAAAPTAIDAGPPSPLPALVAPPLETPAGMLRLDRPDGTPWLFVDRAPVSVGAYAAAAGDPTAKDAAALPKKQRAAPVTGVAYADAEAYAVRLGKRLLTADEWTAAAAVAGWQSAGDLWEWVDDGTRGLQAKRAVRATGGKAGRRPPRGQPTVTFRLARELPAR